MEKDYVNMMNDVAAAIMSIHSKKIIHRDIKPQNIILLNNVYKITDFGVSSEK